MEVDDCQHLDGYIYMPPLPGCRCLSCVNEDVSTWEFWCDDCGAEIPATHPEWPELLERGRF